MVKRKRTTNQTTDITRKNNEINVKDSVNDEEKPWSKSKKKRMRKLLNSQRNETVTNIHSNNSMFLKRSKCQKKTTSSRDKLSDGSRNHSKNNAKDFTDTPQQQEHQSSRVKEDVDDGIVVMTGNTSKPQSALQKAFRARLAGSRFRELNEDLYTSTSASAHQRFTENPELFDQYHQGFRTQVKSWPVNPVDVIFRWLLSLQKKRAIGSASSSRGRSKKRNAANKTTLSVADFGCGDAMLAQKLLEYQKKNILRDEGEGTTKKSKINNKKNGPCPIFSVHSFDLVSNGNPHITPCDMAHVPLEDGSIDVGIFSLALMGTNIADFIREAHRVLSPDGILKIAEVRSRFETTTTTTTTSTSVTDKEKDNGSNQKQNVGRQKDTLSSSFPSKRNMERQTFDQTFLKDFLSVMRQLGFHCKETDRSNTMFFLMEFKKTGANPCREATFTAKPCIYKRR